MRLVFTGLGLAAISVMIVASSSCGRSPFPCFVISELEDSVPVNKEVSFNAYCSDKANEYFWEFPNDSIAYESYVTYTFRDTGTYSVRLMVGNGNKSRTIGKTLIVK